MALTKNDTMKHIVTFSGGKDSLDTILWCVDNLKPEQWDIVFCDTDWEDELTYQYIDEIEKQLGKQIIRLKHAPYPISDKERDIIRSIFGKDNVFAEMIIHKGRFPSTKARFCTEELKSKPMIDYLLGLTVDFVVLQGVRADESQARKNMKENDDYFKFYFEPYKINKKGKPLFHTYRKKEVIAMCDAFTTDVFRPILNKTAVDVFDSIFSHGLRPNPLYFLGMSRVGCFPCVMCQKGEIKEIVTLRPKRIQQLEQLEQLSGSTFFAPAYIPKRFCSKTAIVHVYLEDLISSNSNLYNPKLYKQYTENDAIIKHEDEDGDLYVIKRMKVPTIQDVVKYVAGNPDQSKLFETITGCISVYNICER